MINKSLFQVQSGKYKCNIGYYRKVSDEIISIPGYNKESTSVAQVIVEIWVMNLSIPGYKHDTTSVTKVIIEK